MGEEEGKKSGRGEMGKKGKERVGERGEKGRGKRKRDLIKIWPSKRNVLQDRSIFV